MPRRDMSGGSTVRHDDAGNLRPKAWERARRAFEPGDLAEQLLRLERSRHGCPRLLLAAAAHHFLTQSDHGRSRIIRAYLRSFAPPAETLSADELAEVVELEAGYNATPARRRTKGRR